jgi:ABC-type Zn2+ transport system substrate-binding protein/surface adhesin
MSTIKAMRLFTIGPYISGQDITFLVASNQNIPMKVKHRTNIYSDEEITIEIHSRCVVNKTLTVKVQTEIHGRDDEEVCDIVRAIQDHSHSKDIWKHFSSITNQQHIYSDNPGTWVYLNDIDPSVVTQINYDTLSFTKEDVESLLSEIRTQYKRWRLWIKKQMKRNTREITKKVDMIKGRDYKNSRDAYQYAEKNAMEVIEAITSVFHIQVI